MTVQPKDVGLAACHPGVIESRAMPKDGSIERTATASLSIAPQIHRAGTIVMKHVTTAVFNPRLNMIVADDEETGRFDFGGIRKI